MRDAMTLELDLTKDRETFRAMIAAGVAKFCEDPDAKNALPITRIDIKFDLLGGDCPVIEAYLDTDEEGHPDTGTSKTYGLMDVGQETWAAACQAVDDEPVVVRSHLGMKKVQSEDELDEVVGLFFVDLIKEMRDAGAFRKIRRAQECYLGVSGYDSNFGWPTWEDRGPDNMVQG